MSMESPLSLANAVALARRAARPCSSVKEGDLKLQAISSCSPRLKVSASTASGTRSNDVIWLTAPLSRLLGMVMRMLKLTTTGTTPTQVKPLAAFTTGFPFKSG